MAAAADTGVAVEVIGDQRRANAQEEQQGRRGHVYRNDSITQSPRAFKFFARGARSARANQTLFRFPLPHRISCIGQHFPKTVASMVAAPPTTSPARLLQNPVAIRMEPRASHRPRTRLEAAFQSTRKLSHCRHLRGVDAATCSAFFRQTCASSTTGHKY